MNIVDGFPHSETTMRVCTTTLPILLMACAALSLAACSGDSTSGSRHNQSNNGGANNGTATDGGTNNSTGDAGSTSGGDGGSSSGADSGTVVNNGNGDGTCQPVVIYKEVYQPNVYLLVDRSQSMHDQPMAQAKAGLDAVADALADRVRLGVGAYPFPSAGCGVNDLISTGTHTAAELKDAWAGLQAAGGTPTGEAIYQVGQRHLLSEDGDAHDDQRKKALVVITDGDPTVCEDQHPYLDEARNLAGQGVPIFVVGFHSQAHPDKLDALAEAGGTDAPGAHRFYSANGTQDLADAIRNISNNVISCTQTLDPAPASQDLVSVEIDGQSVPQSADDGFTYDAATHALGVHGSWCDKLQNAAADGTVLAVTVNCPGCAATGNSCSADGECCSGSCLDGSCGTLCRPVGEQCRDSSDCCGNATCSGGDGLVGTCVGG